MIRLKDVSDVYDRYQKFYLEYKDKLFGYLRFKSGDPELALDLMQDSFTRHFQHYGHEAINKPALLFTIARNALIDHQRTQWRQQHTGCHLLQSEPSQETSLQTREEVHSVLGAIKTLAEDDRELLVLVVSGLPYKEISTVTGLSEAAIKVRIHRIRMKIRQIVEEEEQ